MTRNGQLKYILERVDCLLRIELNGAVRGIQLHFRIKWVRVLRRGTKFHLISKYSCGSLTYI